MGDKLRFAIIGLGKQAVENHLPAILESTDATLDSVCDRNLELAYSIAGPLKVPAFESVESLIEVRDIDAAIVCVPHYQYLPIITLLAQSGIHVLKEKPLAMNCQEANEIHSIIQDTGIVMMVTLVRRFHPIYTAFEQIRPRLGRIHTIEGRYTLNIPRLDEGWRSKMASAGGGAVLDMGYHAIDLLVWYFGLPTRIAATIGKSARENQDYDVEDTAAILFSYDRVEDDPPIMGNLLISRAFPQKDERMYIVGSKGTAIIDRGAISRLSSSGERIESLSREGSWLSANISQIDEFCSHVRSAQRVGRPLYIDHFDHMAFVEAVYAAHENKNFVEPRTLLPPFVTAEDHLD